VSFYRQYLTIIGVLSLTVVLSVLLLPLNMILAQEVTFIDTRSYWTSSEKVFVRTKMDLGSVEHMRQFPKMIGQWQGIDYETSQIEEVLNADVILLRAYQSPSFYQSIFLLVMQSGDLGSFHPPPVCYEALGFQIEGEAKEEIPIPSAEWVSYWRSEAEQSASLITANKLVVFKEDNGQVSERRVVLYFYVKKRPAADELTMVRVSALVPIDMPYDGVLSLTKGFMGEVIPNLFEFYNEERGSLATNLAKSGPGWLLMVVLVLIPLAIMAYPRWRRR